MCGVAGRNFYAQNLGLKFFGARDDPSRIISILYGMSIGPILFAVAMRKLFLSKNAKNCYLRAVSNFPSLLLFKQKSMKESYSVAIECRIIK